jgi:selT/selW/selH-like putative selenoprotein
LAAELQEAFPDVELRMIPSGGGRFEVVCDDVPVFEKSKLRRHPSPGEVVRLIEETRRAS